MRDGEYSVFILDPHLSPTNPGPADPTGQRPRPPFVESEFDVLAADSGCHGSLNHRFDTRVVWMIGVTRRPNRGDRYCRTASLCHGKLIGHLWTVSRHHCDSRTRFVETPHLKGVRSSTVVSVVVLGAVTL